MLEPTSLSKASRAREWATTFAVLRTKEKEQRAKEEDKTKISWTIGPIVENRSLKVVELAKHQASQKGKVPLSDENFDQPLQQEISHNAESSTAGEERPPQAGVWNVRGLNCLDHQQAVTAIINEFRLVFLALVDIEVQHQVVVFLSTIWYQSQVGHVRGFPLSNITSTMGDLQVIGGIKKLNNNNYNSWSTCIMSYMQGQDLWEVVNGNDVTQPEVKDANGILRKWKIKAGKAMFILKTTIEEDVLEHIHETKTPKEAWDTFSKLFSKDDTKLQLIESELLSVAQRDLTVAQYFHKVKSLCREISELDPEAPIGEARMKRIIIHGLKSEFRSFIVAVQGWPTQPSLVEFENLLAGRMNSKADGSKRSDDKTRGHQSERSTRTAGGSKNHNNAKKFEGKCYHCGKKGHMARNCWSKKNVAESNIVTSKTDDEWDFEASFAADEDELAFAAIISNQINYESDWIIDSGCSNHMTGDKEKLKNVSKYTGS
ncbi:UNVERIFIED_CONTAM: hypothetical protein Slati_4256600 [Sesamum latifolium]|uniref:CCHC-type domain-containing protein n=1 Tax=Sesamum latifolium TaxID=2727402 RepID=A0AAW2TCK2_9LAMI